MYDTIFLFLFCALLIIRFCMKYYFLPFMMSFSFIFLSSFASQKNMLFITNIDSYNHEVGAESEPNRMDYNGRIIDKQTLQIEVFKNKGFPISCGVNNK